LKNFSWLTDDLKNSDFEQIEAAIEEMGKFDVVVQSKLKEVFLDHILPLREAA
jgi:nitrate reductase NapAB chaperone NapD